MSTRLAAAVAVVAALSCSKSSDSSAPSCDERVDRFAAALAPLAGGRATGMRVPTSIDPIESTQGLPVVQYGPSVVLRRDGMYFNDSELLPTTNDLRERLAVETERMRVSQRTSPLYIWADRRTLSRDVNTVSAASPSELERRLLLAGPRHTASDYEKELLNKPVVRQFSEGVQRLDPSARAVFAAEQIEKSIGTCTPLIKAFGDVAGMDASRKGSFLVEVTPSALRQCRCKVADQDLLEYTMLSIMGAFDRRVTWVPASEAHRFLTN